ncbi:MAG: TrkA family potassium uptake protein [Armatimonadetes bacterium]|nr:TrkA family potassium uptake protein [Armatimonadota bacterium]
MKLLIFGCGRTGAALAITMARRGHEVTMIEQDPNALTRLGQDHGCKTILGDGLNDDVLEKAGIKDAEAFVTTTRGDNTNLMAAQIAQTRYKVPKVCAKVNDPFRAAEYTKMGVMCITPNLLTAGMMRNWLMEEPYGPIDTFNHHDEGAR